MSAPVLRTKLYVPPLRPEAIPRRRLIERLHAGAHRKLTLLSAPAGFGKTTLVSEWVAEASRPAAWLSLDENDSDPVRFLTHLVAALQLVDATIGADVAGMLLHSQPPPAEAILTALFNNLSARDTPVVLVLDDYHAIDAKPVDAAVRFLLDYLPPQLRLVITTRQDPAFALARMRARGELTELRAADLRFTLDEADIFLNGIMGLGLTSADVEALETRTEGWIAGLQLAALSMQGRPDIPAFIENFAGDDRYIVDFLAEEVLRRQPAHVRRFLLQTSILDRFGGPLCDAVTGRTDSALLLGTLERGNLFIIPLDDKCHWYRYHHLFADVLHAALADEDPKQIPTLHLRASDWYARHGDLPAAIHHAFAAGDSSRAADLIELAVPTMSRSRQEATMLSWFRALPDEVLRVRPVLSVDYAGTMLQAVGDIEGAEARLRDAERWLELMSHHGESPPGMVVQNDEGFRRLPGQIAIYRAGQAIIRGDVDQTMTHATEALHLFPEQDDFGHGAATGFLGLAHWTRGELDTGFQRYTECMARLERAGFISDIFGCALVLADIRIAQGRLHDTMRIYRSALERVASHSTTILRGAADMHVGMADIFCEWGDLDAAITHLRTSKDLGGHNELRQNPYRWCVVMAHIRKAQGDPDGAIEWLLEAERLYDSDFSPNVRPVPAMVARMWIARGRLDLPTAWARERALSVEDDLDYLREFEHITLARLLVARIRSDRDEHSIRQAIGFLDRLLHAAEQGGRKGSVIELLLLQALAGEALGDIPAALDPLQRALSVARPEGYFRMFVAEGPPMKRLLAEASRRGIMPEDTSSLLAACAAAPQESVSASAGAAHALADPLSQREQEVLRLVAQGLSNQEIADRLYLALDTVKGHNRRIFAKLGVRRRTEAISRARDMGLL